MRRFIGILAILIATILSTSEASAQQNAVHGQVQGNRIYMSVNPEALKANLDTLFMNSASTQSALNNLTWSDVLGNGTTPGMDVDFFGYNASGLGQVTTTGTFTGDSLVLNKDAAITGRLSVTDVVSLGDSLAVTGVVDFADSLRVVKAVSIGQRLYVTGITTLGDSMHVVGNVDFDAMFNVDGAATFGSSLAVTGKATLNDSLIVKSGVTISNTLTVDSISVTDVINGQVKDISNHDTDDLTEGSTNQYFTQARARGSVSGSTGVTYDSSTGAISIGQAVGTTDDVTFDDLTADSLITSALRVQDGNQAAGKVLTADANGNASWQDFGSGAPKYAQFSGDAQQSFNPASPGGLLNFPITKINVGGFTVNNDNEITLPAGRIYRVDLRLGWVNIDGSGGWCHFMMYDKDTGLSISTTAQMSTGLTNFASSGAVTTFVDATAGDVTFEVRYVTGSGVATVNQPGSNTQVTLSIQTVD